MQLLCSCRCCCCGGFIFTGWHSYIKTHLLTAIIAEVVFSNQFVQPAYLVDRQQGGKKTTKYDLSENVGVKSPHRNVVWSTAAAWSLKYAEILRDSQGREGHRRLSYARPLWQSFCRPRCGLQPVSKSKQNWKVSSALFAFDWNL